MTTNHTADLTPEEEETTRFLQALVGEILRLLAEHFQGETTLNHLRIGSYIGLKSLYEGRSTSNKDIAEVLNISRPTVSRIVGDFIDQGWVVEAPNPEDGRARLLRIADDHPLADNFERNFRVLFNDLLDRYDAGKLIKVDPAKKSYRPRTTPLD